MMPAAGIGLPPDLSVDGYRIDRLLHGTLAATGVLALLLLGWLLFTAIRHREGRREAAYDHGDAPRSRRAVLGAAALVFLTVDGQLLARSLLEVDPVLRNFAAAEADPGAVRIEINARQWAWDARYAGPDGAFNTRDDPVTLNELRIPVGAPILLQVGSSDVVHAFNAPGLRAQVDAVPGQIGRLLVRAREAGEMEIGCAQHCGTAHYKMRGRLLAVPPEEFARWAEETSESCARRYDEADEEARWGWPWRGP